MSSAFALWWAALILELKKRKKWDFQIKLTQAVVHYETGRQRLKASCSIRSQAARAERRAPLACLIELWREAPRYWRCNSAPEPCRTVTPHSQRNSATAADALLPESRYSVSDARHLHGHLSLAFYTGVYITAIQVKAQRVTSLWAQVTLSHKGTQKPQIEKTQFFCNFFFN